MECYQDSATKEWKTRWKVKEGDPCDKKDCFDTQNTLTCKFVWVPESFVCVANTCKEGYKVHGHGCEEKTNLDYSPQEACEKVEGGKWGETGNIKTCACPESNEIWDSTHQICVTEDEDAEEEEKKAYNSNPDIILEKTKDNIELKPLADKYVKGFYNITQDYRIEHDERMKTERKDRQKTYHKMLNDLKNKSANSLILLTEK